MRSSPKKSRTSRTPAVLRKGKGGSSKVKSRMVSDILTRVAPLLDALSDAAYFKNEEGRYLCVNAAFARLTGMPKSRIVGKTDGEVFPADMAEACRASDFKVFRFRKPLRTEEVVGGPGQARKIFDTIKSPVIVPKFGVLGLVGVSRDMSRFQRAEAELKDAEEKLGLVVGDTPIVLFATDKNGVFTLSQGQGLKYLGLKPGEVLGKNVFEFYKHNPAIGPAIRRALKGETFVLAVEEKGRVFETHYSPKRLEDGGVVGVIGVAIDVTERAQVERERERLLEREKALRLEAERVSRSKDDFLALLSHELRTPMTAMIGWTWLLRSKGLGAEDFDMALDTIERNMRMQAQIIEDLLDISRIKSGRMRIESVPVELASALRSSADVARPAAEARSIGIHLDDELPDIVVSGDPERLQQALWNLLTNAVKFTPEGGKVELRLKRFGDTAEISVKDNGMGIAEEYLPHVFEMFSQAEDTMTREHRGLGLGLAIVKQIVEMHGGGVRVHSDGEGKGTEFMVSLPILKSGARPAVSPAFGAAPRRPDSRDYPDLDGVHVLIVEDEHDARMVLSAALQHCGARVTGAATAAEAFDLLRREPPTVLVSDLAMPGEDGFSLMRRIRGLSEEEGGGVPAAALTGRAGPEDRTLALKSGYQMYILKPVEPAELAAAVCSLAQKNKRS